MNGLYTTIARLAPNSPVLADAHLMHHAVNQAVRATTPRRVLWARPNQTTLVIRSASLPDMAEIPGVTTTSTTRTPLPAANTRVEWALVANPSRATGPRDPETGRLIGRSKPSPNNATGHGTFPGSAPKNPRFAASRWADGAKPDRMRRAPSAGGPQWTCSPTSTNTTCPSIRPTP